MVGAKMKKLIAGFSDGKYGIYQLRVNRCCSIQLTWKEHNEAENRDVYDFRFNGKYVGTISGYLQSVKEDALAYAKAELKNTLRLFGE